MNRLAALEEGAVESPETCEPHGPVQRAAAASQIHGGGAAAPRARCGCREAACVRYSGVPEADPAAWVEDGGRAATDALARDAVLRRTGMVCAGGETRDAPPVTVTSGCWCGVTKQKGSAVRMPPRMLTLANAKLL